MKQNYQHERSIDLHTFEVNYDQPKKHRWEEHG